MLAHLDELKKALGIDPAEANVTRDGVLESSLQMANALIAGYIGFDVSDTEKEYPFITVVGTGASHVNLPYYPVLEVRSITSNDTLVEPTGWSVNHRNGIIDFTNGMGYCSPSGRWGQRLLISYRAGFEEIPEELKMVALNLASAIYNMGGTFSSAPTSGAGALKSLTMFDAMSMSFDTGSASSSEESTNTPAGMLKQWSFILNKYRVNSPVMA